MEQKTILIVEDEFIVANDLATILKRNRYRISDIAGSYQDALRSVKQKTPDLALLDIQLKGKETGIDIGKRFLELQIPFIYVSANSNKAILEEVKTTKPLGFLVKPFREKDVLVAIEIALSLYKDTEQYKNQQDIAFRKELDHIAARYTKFSEQLFQIAAKLQTYVPFDSIEYFYKKSDHENCHYCALKRIGYNEYQAFSEEGLATITNTSVNTVLAMVENCYQSSKEVLQEDNCNLTMQQVSDHEYLKQLPFSYATQFLKAIFRLGRDQVVCMQFHHKDHTVYGEEQISFLKKMYPYIKECLHPDIIVEKTITVHTNNTKTAANTSVYTKMGGNEGFEDIVGKSTEILSVFDHIKKVAPVDTSVLIMGESGTGKELIAKKIHQLSARSKMPLVIVNCATLPANLAESILFGHEKGSFTDAQTRQIGKFELADKGSIFLDEIGELSLDLQVKLLRVLQEKEIERIGNGTPIKINTRIIAATNKDLEAEVENGNFRLDLYYRLNIFPILLPPLRQRKDDILLLANHFLKKFATRNKQHEKSFSKEVEKAIVSYKWPGNIRQLEHYIERSILFSGENAIINGLYPPLDTQDPVENDFIFDTEGDTVKTIHEIEREYILSILKKCNGKVFGTGGAAELLKIPSSTLNSKIKKLGIEKKDIYS